MPGPEEGGGCTEPRHPQTACPLSLVSALAMVCSQVGLALAQGRDRSAQSFWLWPPLDFPAASRTGSASRGGRRFGSWGLGPWACPGLASWTRCSLGVPPPQSYEGCSLARLPPPTTQSCTDMSTSPIQCAHTSICRSTIPGTDTHLAHMHAHTHS